MRLQLVLRQMGVIALPSILEPYLDGPWIEIEQNRKSVSCLCSGIWRYFKNVSQNPNLKVTLVLVSLILIGPIFKNSSQLQDPKSGLVSSYLLRLASILCFCSSVMRLSPLLALFDILNMSYSITGIDLQSS